MKLIDKIQKAHSNKPTDYSRLYTPTAEIIEKIAEEFAIDVLEYYNNNFFNIPLKDGEAKMIVNHIKKEKGL
jgi:hypothetical protein